MPQNGRAKARAPRDPNALEVTQVAQLLGCTYQRARNMMLAGAMGPSTYNETTRKLTVTRAGVAAFQARTGKTAEN